MIHLANILESRAGAGPERIAVRDGERRYTYRELYRRSAALAGSLRDLGLRPGAGVGILLPNQPEFVIALFATVMAGGTAVLMDLNSLEDELRQIAETCSLAALVTGPPYLHQAGSLAGPEGIPARLILAGGDAPAGALDMEALTGAETGGKGEAPAPEGEDATCQYTSGVSGRPKVVLRTHENLMHEIRSFSAAVALAETDTVVCAPPLFHAYALITGLLAPLAAGAQVVLCRRFVPGPALALIREARADLFIGIPLFYKVFCETHLGEPADLSSLRLALSAGSPLPAWVWEAFQERFGVRISQLYGSTETGVVALDLSGERPESVGRPIPGVEVQILDRHDRRLPAGAEGEIAVRSASTTRGYLGLPEQNRRVFGGGLFRSGDLGWAGDDGTIHISGRIKNLINVAGKKVDPGEIEAVLAAHPRVRDVAVVGMAHPSSGESIKAFLVVEGTLTREEAIRHCRQRLARHKVPSQIEFLDCLPRSATGKLLRSVLASGRQERD